jgi:hypothetical protein
LSSQALEGCVAEQQLLVEVSILDHHLDRWIKLAILGGRERDRGRRSFNRNGTEPLNELHLVPGLEASSDLAGIDQPSTDPAGATGEQN